MQVLFKKGADQTVDPEHKKIRSQNLHYAYKISPTFNLNGKLSLEKL